MQIQCVNSFLIFHLHHSTDSTALDILLHPDSFTPCRHSESPTHPYHQMQMLDSANGNNQQQAQPKPQQPTYAKNPQAQPPADLDPDLPF